MQLMRFKTSENKCSDKLAFLKRKRFITGIFHKERGGYITATASYIVTIYILDSESDFRFYPTNFEELAKVHFYLSGTYAFQLNRMPGSA